MERREERKAEVRSVKDEERRGRKKKKKRISWSRKGK